jgi:hypothetical protein
LQDTPRLRLHDPLYSLEEIEDLCDAKYLDFPNDLSDCDGIVLITPHSVYRGAAVEGVIRPGTVIVDNFGTWRDRQFAQGIRYHEVGRRHTEDPRDVVRYPEPSSQSTG